MKLLIDSDMLLFRACSATEVEVQLGEDSWARHSEIPLAREFYWGHVSNWIDQFDLSADDVVHCFTDRSAFRRSIWPSYKISRKDKPKPIGYKHLRAEILSEDNAFIFQQIEADDVIGILATSPDLVKEGYVIASGDKDLRQIPGWHVWISNGKLPDADGLQATESGDYTLINVSNDYAERFTYQQYLSGDATDSIPGCPGIGEVRAQRIVADFDLSEPMDCWETVVRTYEQKGKVHQPSEEALLQARLIRILRHGEYDFDTHQVKLWNPPTLTSGSLLST